MMIVTRIEKKGKYKYYVYLDYEFAFWMTWKEIWLWKIEENKEISFELFRDIMKNTVLERAKRKAINYLKTMNRTEMELRNKLKKELFPEEIIEQVIAYLYQYHYIDDDYYIENFIEYKKRGHSRRWMEERLRLKGISREKINKFFQADYSEEEALRKAMEKKLRGKRIVTREEKQKIIAYVYRQGFSISHAQEILKEYKKD